MASHRVFGAAGSGGGVTVVGSRAGAGFSAAAAAAGCRDHVLQASPALMEGGEGRRGRRVERARKGCDHALQASPALTDGGEGRRGRRVQQAREDCDHVFSASPAPVAEWCKGRSEQKGGRLQSCASGKLKTERDWRGGVNWTRMEGRTEGIGQI
eukprot:366239-Chlamydomonas_euryale.AAC.2